MNKILEEYGKLWSFASTMSIRREVLETGTVGLILKLQMIYWNYIHVLVFSSWLDLKATYVLGYVTEVFL